MKKTLVATLTGALVLGATATNFAAANPFSDVPAGHWAYNSVTKLANEGIIEGYGDNTFRGNRNITRYEMAQMIARALAKAPSSNMNYATRAELDKLAAEFREELDSLGVRVAELEKNADRVQWTGELRYRYNYDRRNIPELSGGGNVKSIRNQLQLRLFPTATINDHWKVKARLTASNNMRFDAATDVALTFAYAEGKYGNFTVDLGRMPLFSNADQGLVVDDFFGGARVIVGNDLKFQLEGGRWGGGPFATNSNDASYVGAELLYNKDKFNGGLAYRYFKDRADVKYNIFSAGLGYQFTDKLKLSGAYAHNSKALLKKNSYNIELNYGNTNRKDPGSWGVYAAYRYVSYEVGLAPTYSTWFATDHKRGFEVGATYTPFKNTLAQVSYFDGKMLSTKERDKQFYGRLSWFF